MKWGCIDEIILNWEVYSVYLHHNRIVSSQSGHVHHSIQEYQKKSHF